MFSLYFHCKVSNDEMMFTNVEIFINKTFEKKNPNSYILHWFGVARVRLVIRGFITKYRPMGSYLLNLVNLASRGIYFVCGCCVGLSDGLVKSKGGEKQKKKEKENLRGDEGYSQNIEQKGKKRDLPNKLNGVLSAHPLMIGGWSVEHFLRFQ